VSAAATTGGAPGTARRMWRALETLHMTVYFNPEPRDAYRRAGLRGGWMGYFASRSAAMGPVPAEVVVATFYNFHPRMVHRAIPDAWGFATPAEVLAARYQGADAALGAASRELEEARPGRVPSHLQSASYAGEKKLGIGVGYVYPHDQPGHWVAQRYLPEGLRGGYYRPTDQGQEAAMAEAWRRRRGQPDGEPPDRQAPERGSG